MFAPDGVGTDEVIISHVGFTADPVAASDALFRRGANVSFDRIGSTVFFPDEHWIALIANAKGHLGKVLLSHDAASFAYGLEMASGENLWDDYRYISRVFLPRLRSETNVTEEDIHQMLVTNPQRSRKSTRCS